MLPVLALLPLLLGTRVDASAGVGVDSNPFELPSPAPTAGATLPQPGSYFTVRALAETKTAPESPFGVGVRGVLDADLYGWVAQAPGFPTHAGDANHGTATIAVPGTWTPLSDRTLILGFEPSAAAHRETFTSPFTGRPYTFVDATSGLPISLARRFDTNRFGARASVESAPSSSFDAYAALSLQRVDYLDDYHGVASIDSWDYTEARLDGDAWLYRGDWIVSAAYSLRRRAYDQRFPHYSATDPSAGNPVLPGTAGFQPQLFWFHDGTLRAGIERESGRALLRLDVERRVDAYAGYLSYTELGASADLRNDVRDWSFSLAPSFSVWLYDTARVNYDPAEPVNRRTRLEATGMVERRLGHGTSLWASLTAIDQESSSPLYSYRAVRALTGVRLLVH